MRRFLPYFVTMVVTIAITAGVMEWRHRNQRKTAAQTVPMQVYPAWMNPGTCTVMNGPERREAELAAEILRTSPEVGSLRIGALRYFSRPKYRKGDGKTVIELCLPEDIISGILDLLVKRWFTDVQYLHEDTLGVARVIGPRHPKIIEAVGKTAFRKVPVRGGPYQRGKDIRSLARVILAEYGTAAGSYAVQAYETMSYEDALGTASAQLAVAAGHPEALGQTAKMIRELVTRYPSNPIPQDAGKRMYELSRAMVLAGEKANVHIPLLLEILNNRQVESWAGWHGMLSVRPRGLCTVLKRIGGKQAADDNEHCKPISRTVR